MKKLILLTKRLILYSYKKWKSGTRVQLYLSLKCNLNCNYCGNKNYNGKMPNFKWEMTLNQWKNYIITFPTKIKRLDINGGEPFMVKYIVELLEFLIERHIYVYVYTNLTYYKKIKPSYFLRLIATLHETQNIKLFNTNLNKYKQDGHILDIFEIGNRQGFSVRNFCVLEYCMTPDYFRVAPDGTIQTNHFDLMEYLNLWQWQKKKFDNNIDKKFKCDGTNWNIIK